MKIKSIAFLLTLTIACVSSNKLLAGPKGVVQVPRIAGPITIDGDFSDWPLQNYDTLAQQPVFPDAQGVGVPTGAMGNFIAWDIDRVGPFNGSDAELYEGGPNEYGSSVYFAFDDTFLYVLGVFIDDEAFGGGDESGFSNFLNDGFEFFIDALNNSEGTVADTSFPSFDEDDENLDDFQFTMGLNEFFGPDPLGPDELGVEIHMERAGDPELPKLGYLENVREELDLSTVGGGRDVAAKSYSDLRAAGATNPELAANPDATFSGYAVEFVLPFGIVEGFTPDHNMGFDLFWRDVDDPADPDPGYGGAGAFWADWAQNVEVSAEGEDGNLFNGGNWGQLEFITAAFGDFDSSGAFDAGDIDLLAEATRAGDNNAAFDVNGDGVVDQTDIQTFVESPEFLNSFVGDSNLDGQFNSSDFVLVFQAGEYEDDLAGNSTWATGDWTGDSEFNSGDLVFAFQRGGFEIGERPAPGVPEPTSAVMLLIGLCGLALQCRKHSR